MTDKKKKSFFKRNKETIKKGTIVGVSAGTIGAVIGAVIAHIAVPATGLISIPIFLNCVLAIVIKKAPESFGEVKRIVMDALDDQDVADDVKERFVDEVASQYTAKTSRTLRTEPCSELKMGTPSETEEYRAIYHPKRNFYEVMTPRPPTTKQ